MREETRNALEKERSNRNVVLKDYGNGSSLVDTSHSVNFVEGAEWYLEYIWHSEEEVPEQEKDIIMLKRPPIGGCFHGNGMKADGSPYWYLYDGYSLKEVVPSRWCYAEDIVK